MCPPIEMPGHGEGEGEVDEDQHHRLAHQRAGREVLEDEERADEAEDRPGRADRDRERAS